MPMTVEQIEHFIKKAIPDANVEIEDLKGDGDHYSATVISKSFSDKQIDISPKLSEYIIKNIERSYEKVFKFIKEIDDLSLSSGKSININLIKKVLINE